MTKGNKYSVLTAFSAFVLIQQGEAAFGQQVGTLVGGYDQSAPAGALTLPLTTGTYAAGAALGGLQAIAVWRTQQNPSGFVTGSQLMSQSGATGSFTQFVFDAKPALSTCVDTVAFALNSADVGKLAFAPLTITPTIPQNSTASVGNATIPAPPVSVHNHDIPATTNVYTCLVPNALYTATATDLLEKLSAAQD